MAKIIESIVTKNRCYTGGRKITVRGLMLHSVGCPQQKAHVFVSTWNSQTAGVCPHGIIDGNDGIVYQTLPWDHRGWHGGSGSRGSGNNTHIGIEMCEPACIRYTSDSRFTCSDPAKAKAVVRKMSYLVSFSAAPEEHMEDWKVGEFDTWVCCIKESSHHSSTPYKAWTPYKAKTQLSWRSKHSDSM